MKTVNTWKTLLSAGLFACLAAGIAFAQTKPPKYDPKSEVQLKGTVEEVKVETERGASVLHLTLKSGADSVDVSVGPPKFVEQMEYKFDKGDEVQVLGAKESIDKAEVLVAREVTKGNDTLILRDKRGAPVWVGWKR